MASLPDGTSSELLKLGELIQGAIQTCAGLDGAGNGDEFPSRELFDAKRNLVAAAGKLIELVADPSNRLQEVSAEYFEARALHIVADRRVADILAGDDERGVETGEIAKTTGIEALKLARLMRCLCSAGLFREVSPDRFANNRISARLVNNEPLRAYILLFACQFYAGSEYLPHILNDPVKGPSYDVTCTPLQDALNSPKPMWEWIEEKVKVKDLLAGNCGSNGSPSPYAGAFGAELEKAVKGHAEDDLVSRPEFDMLGLAMIGGGNATGLAHVHDYPWASLGAATVVDVGGGLGGFCIELCQRFPDLDFVVQDRPPVVAAAETKVWPAESPAAVQQGRVKFMPHDFFQENPVKGAGVYWLRYILHDWSDEYVVRILSALRSSMGPKSRILLCEFLMTSTVGCEELPRAPEPLPANWGYFTRYAHERDIAMMTGINGIERRPAEYELLLAMAGLSVTKFWDCRSSVGLIEAVLHDSPLLRSG